jgi:hypothetical protein
MVLQQLTGNKKLGVIFPLTVVEMVAVMGVEAVTMMLNLLRG